MNINLSGKSEAPVFVLGFPRSGTTWVNTILRQYLSVGLVNEGQFITSYAKRTRKYKISDLEKFVSDLSTDSFFTILKRNYGVDINWGRIMREESSYYYPCLVRAIISEIAEKTGKVIPGSKNPGFGWDMDILLEMFPNCQLIHIIRDGRDCALSHYRLRWGCQNAYVAAMRWKKYVNGVRHVVQHKNSNYLEVFYENLLQKPEENFLRIKEFIFKDRANIRTMYDYSDAVFSGSINQDEYVKRANKWKRYMTEGDKRIFEGVAGDTLQKLGYELEGGGTKTRFLSRVNYVTQDKIYRQFWLIAKKFKTIEEIKSSM